MSRPLPFPIPERAGDALSFLRLLWAIDHLLQERSKAMLIRLGVTGPQRLVLRVLARHPDLTAGQLAGFLHLHPSTVSGILGRLEQRRLVVRRMDDLDRRRVRLALSRKGLELARPRRGTLEDRIEEALQGLEPEQRRAAELALSAVADRLAATDG
jgi:DNA-binding MarR family transcriptional regulator